MASDPSGGPSDPFAKRLPRPRKRKSPSQSTQEGTNLPQSKVARIGHSGKKHHHHHHHQQQQFVGGGGGGGAAAQQFVGGAAVAARQHLDDWEDYVDDDDVQDDEANDGLPMEVSTVLDPGQEPLEPWSLITKGFFQAKGATFRAGYTVYHRGLCIARAIFWNDEFDEVRFQHQGPCSSLVASVSSARGASTMTHVSVGLMAVLDALGYARSVRCCWQVFVDNNLEVLRLIDMYQRNWKFLKYHAERLLLHQIMECARQQAGRIHLRRK